MNFLTVTHDKKFLIINYSRYIGVLNRNLKMIVNKNINKKMLKIDYGDVNIIGFHSLYLY